MSVGKLKAASAADLMKSEEPNDSLDTFIRQAIGKEPFLSLSKPGDTPVQWIQLLHALDQQDLPGWPLLTPLKVQMQKCDKCSREFCSPINYRRHIRVHHRLKKLDKDSAKNRGLLAAFWDKLSEDEAKEVISFKDVSLEEVPGPSVIKSLTTLVKRPGFSALPQVCLRAGSALLDIVQTRPSRFPISSQELFSILDDASEKTFLCGAAVSMQKYIFDGEAGKIGLETKNLVSSTSFLVEQKLVKAWLADKDAEALRCQKLLVEEEEAAQKRQVELLERRKQKKLRQKEQKAKDQRHGEMEVVKQDMDDSLGVNIPAETSSSLAACDFDRQNPVTLTDQVLLSMERIYFSNPQEDVDYKMQMGFSNGYCDPGTSQNIERRMEQAGGHRHIVVARWKTPPKSQRGVPTGLHASQNSIGFKFGGINKHGTNRERVAAMGNGNKMWSRKPKAVNDGESLKSRAEKQAANQLDQNQLDQNKNHEVLIGSISVTLGNCSHHEGNNLTEAHDRCLADYQIPKKNNVHEKSSKLDPVQGVTNRSTIKFWRPVSRHESKSSLQVQNGIREFEVEVIAEKDGDQTSSNESCLRSWVTDSSNGVVSMNTSTLEESLQPGSLQFDSHAAKVFLAGRWKEAFAGEHLTLVLSPNLELPGCSVVEIDSSEKWMVRAGPFEASTGGAAKGKFRTKPEKGAKIRYIPKQRSAI
ncbi:C2H2-like zinc finger protein, putative [Theobroma cacao]|uniref:C2H2-like zinc finger protein, putative n=1 Tax=Theobroma cacao TaxID=3641 RepID=A0A061G098_THECC|nr:C2H2-like zinc finger protein, putative [Theobroma cacao]